MTDPELPAPFEEAAALRSLQRDARVLVNQLAALAQLKPGDAEALDKLQKTIASLPSGEQLARAVDELRGRAEHVLSSARSTRADSFGRYEADFIRTARAAGMLLRESGNAAWRLGPIELEVQRERSRARVLYNREALTGWTPVGSRADLDKLTAAARLRLEAAALADDALPVVFSEAYEHLRRSHSRVDTPTVRVPLLDFFREVRVALARHELREGKPDRKLTRIEFPRWAFLYNLDRYRQLLPHLPAERRLSFETGSQHDHQKGLAMVVNGLDAGADYKSYCYVYAAPAQQS